nr:MAG TPA: hypothetical protein [Caudoviricetes sp.]
MVGLCVIVSYENEKLISSLAEALVSDSATQVRG